MQASAWPRPSPLELEQQQQARGTPLVPKAIPVRFALQRRVKLGQAHALVGNLAELGAWDLAQGLKMGWGENHVWAAEASLAPGTVIEFKVGGWVGGSREGLNMCATSPGSARAVPGAVRARACAAMASKPRCRAQAQQGQPQHPVELPVCPTPCAPGSTTAAMTWLPGTPPLLLQCVRVNNNQTRGAVWEGGPNHVVAIPNGVTSMTVQVNWEADVEVSVQQAPAGEEQQREAAVGAGRAGSPAKASLQYWQ